MILKGKGFTLIELLVTITVIAVTVYVAIPNLRNLNQRQSLTTTSGDIIRSARKALVNAQSGVNCSGGSNSVSWSLIFTSTTGYQTQAQCGTPNSNIPGSVESKNISPATISIYCTSPAGLKSGLATVTYNSSTFQSNLVSLPCSNSSDNFIIKLTDSQQGITCIQFTPSGVITENEKCTNTASLTAYALPSSLPAPTSPPAGPLPTPAPNLVDNTGAESGTTTEWGGYNATVATVNTSITTPNSGSYSFKITNNNGASIDTMYDNPPTVPNPALGAEYSATAWVKSDGGAGSLGKNAQIVLRQKGGTTAQLENSSTAVTTSFSLTTSWQQITVSATINAPDRTSLEVYLVQNSSSLGAVIYIDDITLKAVPPAVNTESVANGYGTFVSQSSNPVFPPANWRPYADTAIFNQRVPTTPKVNPNSEVIVNAWFSRTMDDMSIGLSSITSTYKDYNHPIYFSKSTDPIYTITCTKYGGACEISGTQIKIPVGAKPANGGDGHLAVIDQSTNTEYDLWQAATPSGTGGPLSISWGGKTDITGDGLNSDGTAAWFGEAGGNIRGLEWSAGVIDHALFIVMKCDNGQTVSPGALTGHGSKCGTTAATLTENPATAAPMGARFYLAMTDTEIDATGLESWKRILMKAMAHYGMYFGDTGGTNWEIKTESGFTYTSFGYTDPLITFAQNNGAYYYLAGGGFYIFKFPEIKNYTNKIFMIDP